MVLRADGRTDPDWRKCPHEDWEASRCLGCGVVNEGAQSPVGRPSMTGWRTSQSPYAEPEEVPMTDEAKAAHREVQRRYRERKRTYG